MALYREESFVKISWDEKTGIVWVTWKDHAIGDELRTGMKLVLQLLKEKNAQSLVLDLEMVGMIDLENQHWLANKWLPEALTGGLKCIAYIMPVSGLVKLSVKNAIEKLEHKDIENACFDSTEAATRWLLKN